MSAWFGSRVQTFNTVFFDNATGQWITSRGQIALNYLRSWFWVDAPSSVPVELVDIFVQNNSLGLLRFLRMFRLLRLLRLLKIEEYVDTLENAFDVNLRILRVVFMLIKICFLSHILGCFCTRMPACCTEGRCLFFISVAHCCIRRLVYVAWSA
jgi:hypothetical protein